MSLEVVTRDEISNIHVSVTNTKNKKNARRNLHSLKLSDRRKFQRIVSGVDINVIKDEVKSSEVIMNTYYVNSLEDLLKESKKLINYINYNLPRICKWIYKKARPDVQIESDFVAIGVEKISLQKKQNEFTPVPFKISSQKYISNISLGKDVVQRHKKENTLCIGKVLYKATYFNTTNNVYQVELYNGIDDENSLNSTNLEDFSVYIDIPLQRNESSPKCAIWTDPNIWDTTKCKTQTSQQIMKCSCKSLGYFSIVSAESNGMGPMSKSNAAITQSPFKPTISADKLIKNTIGYDASSNVTVLTPQNEGEDLSTAMKIATTSVMVCLAVGILSSVGAWYVIYRRNRNAVRDNTVSYGRYFDEHTLEDVPEQNEAR